MSTWCTSSTLLDATRVLRCLKTRLSLLEAPDTVRRKVIGKEEGQKASEETSQSRTFTGYLLWGLIFIGHPLYAKHFTPMTYLTYIFALYPHPPMNK